MPVAFVVTEEITLKLFRFWSRATATIEGPRSWPVSCFGASNQSVEDAGRDAKARIERIVAAIRRGDRLGTYAYADRPLREEILEEHRDAAGAVILSRNSYGSVVLNTSSVFFADIDLPERPRVGLLARWFGGRQTIDPEAEIFERVENTAREFRMGVRLYRTAAGFRAMITNRTFQPGDAVCRTLLDKFGSDPLYVHLCDVQESFRARISPKHWRCHAPPPPSRFPFMSESEESNYRAWESVYEKHSGQFATCELVREFGSPAQHAEVQPVVELHDRWSLREGRPLA